MYLLKSACFCIR